MNLLLARIVGFIILSFLCKLIFNTNIYSHHYLGVSIIILYYIILILISPVIFSWYSLILIVGTTIFECLDIVYKWLMDIKYISPYELSGFKGIFLTIILLILNASLQNVPCKSDSFIVFLCLNTVTITDFNNSFSRLYEDGIKAILLLFFGSFLCSTFYTMLNFLTIKYLGPTLRIFCELLYSVYIVYSNNKLEDQTMHIISIISLVLVVIGSCIYVEFIIIHICGFDYNTRDKINSRGVDGSSAIEIMTDLNENNDDKLNTSMY